MKKTLAALFTALTLSIAACGGGAASAAGVYEIDKAALKAAITASMPAEAKDKMPAEMLDGMVNGMNISIELKAGESWASTIDSRAAACTASLTRRGSGDAAACAR